MLGEKFDKEKESDASAIMNKMELEKKVKELEKMKKESGEVTMLLSKRDTEIM